MKSLALTVSATHDSEDTNLRTWIRNFKASPKITTDYIGVGGLSEMRVYHHGVANTAPSSGAYEFKKVGDDKLYYTGKVALAKAERPHNVPQEVKTQIDAVIERVSDEIIDLSCQIAGRRTTVRIPQSLIPIELLAVGTAVKISVDPDSVYRRLRVERRELPNGPVSEKIAELREWAAGLE